MFKAAVFSTLVPPRIISIFIDITTLLIITMLILKSLGLINQDNLEIIVLLPDGDALTPQVFVTRILI